MCPILYVVPECVWISTRTEKMEQNRKFGGEESGEPERETFSFLL